MNYEYKGTIIEADEEGFLTDISLWTPELARRIAQRESLQLSDDRWEVVNFLRHYYIEYGITPGMRVLAKAIRNTLGADKGTSKYLYELFPEGPVRQAGKIAGLPKPTSCI